MVDIIALVVRYVHVFFAILWIGSMGFSVMVLGRVMPRLGMPVGRQFSRQFIPVVLRFVPLSAVMTIASGALLYLFLGNFDPAELWGTSWGLAMIASLVLTLALFAFGIFAVMGASRKLLVHLNEEACTHGPDVGRLQKSFGRGQVISFGLGALVLALMIVATEIH